METRAELVVGCYTVGDYEQVANTYLLPSLKRLGLAHVVREIQSRGSWLLNNSACQLYLQRLDKEFPYADFLYVDVDGVVCSDPWSLLRELRGECDVAAYYLQRSGKPVELLSGTLYLPANTHRTELLNDWVSLNQARENVWDQRNLQTLLDSEPVKYKCAHLPATYCCIFDTQRYLTPDIVPVIEHFQASRKHKKNVR